MKAVAGSGVLPVLLAAAAIALGGTLAGCGQTGALYFDENPPADQLPPSKKGGKAAEPPPPPASR